MFLSEHVAASCESIFFFFPWAEASKVVTMQNLGLVGMITIEWPKELAGPFFSAKTVSFLRFWDMEKTNKLRVERRQTL